jgi:hypothetical protein
VQAGADEDRAEVWRVGKISRERLPMKPPSGNRNVSLMPKDGRVLPR